MARLPMRGVGFGAAAALAALCSSCGSCGVATDSGHAPTVTVDKAPRLPSCTVTVAPGTVRFTVEYAHARPPPEAALVIASIRRSDGEEVLRIFVRGAGRSILVSASDQELLGAEGYLWAATSQGGTIEFTIPERAPGGYDLAGLKGRAHVVLQVEQGEGAFALGEVDSGEVVF